MVGLRHTKTSTDALVWRGVEQWEGSSMNSPTTNRMAGTGFKLSLMQSLVDKWYKKLVLLVLQQQKKRQQWLNVLITQKNKETQGNVNKKYG